jgi:hypothetical protein
VARLKNKNPHKKITEAFGFKIRLAITLSLKAV